MAKFFANGVLELFMKSIGGGGIIETDNFVKNTTTIEVETPSSFGDNMRILYLPIRPLWEQNGNA